MSSLLRLRFVPPAATQFDGVTPVTAALIASISRDSPDPNLFTILFNAAVGRIFMDVIRDAIRTELDIDIAQLGDPENDVVSWALERVLAADPAGPMTDFTSELCHEPAGSIANGFTVAPITEVTTSTANTFLFGGAGAVGGPAPEHDPGGGVTLLPPGYGFSLLTVGGANNMLVESILMPVTSSEVYATLAQRLSGRVFSEVAI